MKRINGFFLYSELVTEIKLVTASHFIIYLPNRTLGFSRAWMKGMQIKERRRKEEEEEEEKRGRMDQGEGGG